MRTRVLVPTLLLSFTALARAAPPLQTFTLKDYLNHRWVDELVHFDFEVATQAKELTLTDAGDSPVPCQFTDVQKDKKTGRLTGKVWTVVTVEAKSEVRLQLREGKRTATTALVVKKEGDLLLLGNDRMTLALSQWPGVLKEPVDLSKLPAPFVWVSGPDGKHLGAGEWVTDGREYMVQEATTTVVEQGPVRARVRQHMTFADGRTHDMVFQLADRQDAVLITEDTTLDAPKAGFRFSFTPGLEANRVYWHNQWKQTENAGTWALTNTAVRFDKENVVCKLRPWSFWWLGDITEWAGFYRDGGERFVGILALRPSRWSPPDWDGFDRTETPVVAGPQSRLDVMFAFLATTKKARDGTERELPMRREWALTVGSVAEHVTDKETPKLRQQLVKYSEFPLDEVKDYGFGFKPAKPGRVYPFLLFTAADIDRVRDQVERVPTVKAEVEAAKKYIAKCGGVERTLKNEGWQGFYTKHYLGNYLVEKLPIAYIGSNDPLYGQLMAAAVKGLAQGVRDTFMEKPFRPAIGAYGPWFSETMTRLLLNYDLIAGSGLLTPEENDDIRNMLVFGAHVLAHPDYWNTAKGLCSANPNMTSSILLPRGLLALLLDGHPKSKDWLKEAEVELQNELQDWVSPGGAWIECPGYQAASLDGMFLLAQAIKNMLGRDYFADPQFKATMEYYGFLLTPPDPRFPPGKPDEQHPMVIPSIGDMFSGWITCFNGWMAAATAKSDPDYSARQQWYWKMQNFYLGSAGRAKGFSMVLTNPDLPAKPPAEVARAFPGFGSILRTSWTDPKALYLAHRTGPNIHHYHDDHNSIVLYAKGAPLCTDFGNCYAPVHRRESWYHNRVSWSKEGSPVHYGTSGQVVEIRSLPGTVDYSYGKSVGGGNQWDHRHILLLKSADPLGANYVVMRDKTSDGQPNQKFYWNLWCLSQEPQVANNVVHFPGQFGVDLDVHFLAPANPQYEKDHWGFTQHIYVWGPFAEEQYAIRVSKQGSQEDFFTVLYPRTSGQPTAQVTPLAEGMGAQVVHTEGADWVILSPDKPAGIATGDTALQGEIVFVRKYSDGALRLTIIKGESGKARSGEWELSSSRPASIEVRNNIVSGETSGDAHTLTIALPDDITFRQVLVDGRPAAPTRQGRMLTLSLPAGSHTFTLK